MKWFKFYGQDYLTDSKLGSLNPFQRLMWVTLLCIASQDENKSGVLKHINEARVMALSGLNYEDMESMYGVQQNETLETFCNMGLVTWINKDTLLIKNYNKKQTQQSTSTERVAAWRERNQAKDSHTQHVTDETNVTLQSNGRVDKNRLDKREEREKPESSINFLKNIPTALIEELKTSINCSEQQIKSKATDLILYCEANGKRYKNYKAFLINALRKDFGPISEADKQRNADLHDRLLNLKKKMTV